MSRASGTVFCYRGDRPSRRLVCAERRGRRASRQRLKVRVAGAEQHDAEQNAADCFEEAALRRVVDRRHDLGAKTAVHDTTACPIAIAIASPIDLTPTALGVASQALGASTMSKPARLASSPRTC